MSKPILIICLLSCVLGHGSLHAQGKLLRVKGHYVGVLDFYNNHPNQNYRVPHPNPANNGFFDKNGWAGDDEVKFRGLLKGAVLNVDWWLLFGEPVVNYTFVWTSTSSYEVQYKDPKRGQVTVTVNRSELTNYPNLLRRFDSLRPLETNFEIRWSIGDQSPRDREAFKRHYRLFGSIGGQAPHVKTGMTTRIRSSGIICEGPNIKPFSAPSSPRGGWKEFGALPDSFTPSKISMLSKYFSIANAQKVSDFRATQVQWPLKEFKAIAMELARIQTGVAQLSPVEEVRRETKKALPAYAANDTWNGAVSAPIAPAPPVPRSDRDGLYYFRRADGTKAFSQGFVSADEFSRDPFESRYARVTIRSTSPALYNYIDRTGRLIFDTPRMILQEVAPDLFVVGDRVVKDGNEDATQRRQGLYDLSSRTYLLTESPLLDCGGYPEEQDGDNLFTIKTRKLNSISAPFKARDTYVIRMVTWVRVRNEHVKYQFNAKTRTLRETERRLDPKEWEAKASSFLPITPGT